MHYSLLKIWFYVENLNSISNILIIILETRVLWSTWYIFMISLFDEWFTQYSNCTHKKLLFKFKKPFF